MSALTSTRGSYDAGLVSFLSHLLCLDPECSACSPASLLGPSCPLYPVHFLVLPPCWRKPTCVLMGRRRSLPSTDVTSQILFFPQLLFLSDCVPWTRVGLYQSWKEPTGWIGSHRNSWKGRVGKRHSPDPVIEVTKTREARKGQPKANEEQGRAQGPGALSLAAPDFPGFKHPHCMTVTLHV